MVILTLKGILLPPEHFPKSIIIAFYLWLIIYQAILYYDSSNSANIIKDDNTQSIIFVFF